MAWAFIVIGESKPFTVAKKAPARTAPKKAAVTALYRTTRNGNMRKGPATSFEKTVTLAKGTRVEVIETVSGGRWHHISRNGKPIGYVYAPLIAPVK